jgi:hypothetical protein
MTLQGINPDDLPVPEMYTQVIVATGSKLVFDYKRDEHVPIIAKRRFRFKNRSRS